MTDRVGPGRAGLVLAVCVGVLVLLAVVAGVVAATRPGPQLPAGSPEATVQDYLQRVQDHDLEGAAQLLDPDGDCGEDDLELSSPTPEVRAVLRSTSTDADGARVRVDLVQGGDGPFGGDGWTDEQTFDLVRHADGWVLTGVPWPLYSCDPGPEHAP